MSSLVSQRSSPKEKESSPKVDRVVGFSRSRNTPSSRRGVRRRHQSQSPTRVTLNEDAVPALALSLASTAMSLSSDSSPNSGKIYPRGGKQEMSQNRTRDLPNSRTRGHRSGSASDGEEEEDDREEAVPMAEVFNETAFRKMYVCSDFAAKKATNTLKSLHIPSEKPPMLCKHGLKLGICTESECCTIVKAKITRSDRRMSGKYTGRKLVEVRETKKREKCWSSASLAKTLPSPLSVPHLGHLRELSGVHLASVLGFPQLLRTLCLKARGRRIQHVPSAASQ